MRILLAKHAGFCFGVQRAVKKALELAREGKQLVSLGDLIHNQRFVDYLREKGISSVERVEGSESESQGVGDFLGLFWWENGNQPSEIHA